MNLKQKIKWFFQKRFKDYKLSKKMKKRSVRKYKKLYKKFVRKNRRNPNKKEIRFLIISASHITCKMHGNKGHWMRQRIREFLFNMNGMNYKKR